MADTLYWVKEVINEETETRSLLTPSEYFPDYPNYRDQSGAWKMNIEADNAFMTSQGFQKWTQAQIDEWHAQYDPPTPPYVRQRCTKYQLVTCLRTHYPALLTTFRTAYAANTDLQFYWNTVNDLDRNNEDFKVAQQALGITDEQVDEIFSKIEGEEPAAVEG